MNFKQREGGSWVLKKKERKKKKTDSDISDIEDILSFTII